MSTLKVVVVDDEPLAVNILVNYISQIKELELVKTFSNAVDATSYLGEHAIDLLFLDINMPLLSGLDFLASLQKRPMVVMTTAHEEYALKSFELEALDYLVKPIPFPRFLKAVNRIKSLLAATEKNAPEAIESPHIFVKVDKKKMQKIYFDDIVVIESLKDYIRIKTNEHRYIVHKTLGSFTEELPFDQFIRIHRSYTVSIAKVSAVEGNSLVVDGLRYTIGRSYLTDVKDRILDNVIL